MTDLKQDREKCGLEKYLIEHCSPTLASLKTANLFVMEAEGEEQLKNQLFRWNLALGGKGISLLVLRYRNHKALIYVCRKNMLNADLQKPGVGAFLTEFGYSVMTADATLAHLKERIAGNDEFPHEIGIFLGYPLGDVIGFIENAGQNSKCSGCWKVYCNECEAMRLFAQYKKCRRIYLRLWNEGTSVVKLCVAERIAQRNVMVAAG